MCGVLSQEVDGCMSPLTAKNCVGLAVRMKKLMSVKYTIDEGAGRLAGVHVGRRAVDRAFCDCLCHCSVFHLGALESDKEWQHTLR